MATTMLHRKLMVVINPPDVERSGVCKGVVVCSERVSREKGIFRAFRVSRYTKKDNQNKTFDFEAF